MIFRFYCTFLIVNCGMVASFTYRFALPVTNSQSRAPTASAGGSNFLGNVVHVDIWQRKEFFFCIKARWLAVAT